MKRLKNILFLVILVLMPTLILLFNWKIPCIFKKVFNISCPTCGLTRSIISLLNLDIHSSLNYNILGIPIFLFITVSIVFSIIDIIRNKTVYIDKLLNVFEKYYYLIILVLTISMILNNIKKI